MLSVKNSKQECREKLVQTIDLMQVGYAKGMILAQFEMRVDEAKAEKILRVWKK